MTNTLSGYLWLISGFNFRQFHCKNIRIYFNPVYPKFNIALQKYDFWLFHGHFCPENWPILTVRSFKATWWRQKTGIFISSLESPGKTLRCPLMKNSIFYLSILFLSGFSDLPVGNRFWLFCTLIGQPVSWFRCFGVASLCVERKLNLRLMVRGV